MIRKQCHVIAVTGGKGGVGKSVLAANLALATQLEFKSPTLLIDLDNNSCGDQSVILGLKSKYNVNQLSKYQGAFNEQSLGNILGQHQTGLSYLSAISGSDQKLECDLSLFKKQLFNFSQFYNYIFVDIGCEISDLQREVLNVSSAILVVVTPEVLVMNQTKRILSELTYLPSALFQIIVNKSGKLGGLSSSMITNGLRHPILSLLPEDAKLLDSLHSSNPHVISNMHSPFAKNCHEIIRKLNSGILKKGKELESQIKSFTAPKKQNQKNLIENKKEHKLDSLTLLKMQIHSELIKEMDLKKDLTQAKDEASKKELRKKTEQVISRLVDLRGQGLSREQRAEIIKHILDESLGLGILEELLADSQVTEIMVNGYSQIYYEKQGALQLSPYTITSNQHLRNIIERIVTPLGRRIDDKTPYVDARLQDGSRVNAIIEPLSMDGPILTIRKFPEEKIIMNDLVYRFRSITKEMADFLKICVEQGLNIVISGGTGSGKTTLLNVLSRFIPSTERIITVEDAAELQLDQDHVVRLETRPANMEGGGAVTIRDLIRNSLRMRPDRIVVGECRDGAALDMLSAMNTGHDGSLTTVHANTPREAISRLETLCLMAGMDLPVRAIREQVATAVHLIVQIGRFNDGGRRIKSIAEVSGLQGDVITLQEIFKFKEEGFEKDGKIIGQFQASGIIPTCIEDFERKGLKIPRDLFTTKSSSDLKKLKNNKDKPKVSFAKPKVIKTNIENFETIKKPIKRKVV